MLLNEKQRIRYTQGRIQDFKLGGAHLKKSRQAEGVAKNFGVFRVKNHDFVQKKIIFFRHKFPILRLYSGINMESN